VPEFSDFSSSEVIPSTVPFTDKTEDVCNELERWHDGLKPHADELRGPRSRAGSCSSARSHRPAGPVPCHRTSIFAAVGGCRACAKSRQDDRERPLLGEYPIR
jgi:hypothetical protein